MALKIGAKSPSNEGKNRKFFRTGVKAITWWEEDKEGLEEHTEWREEVVGDESSSTARRGHGVSRFSEVRVGVASMACWWRRRTSLDDVDAMASFVAY